MTNSDENQIKEETYRIIYQSYQDRNNQLSALNYAMLGFTVAFLAVMITVYSSVFSEPCLNCGQKVGFLFFIVFISILEITLWRVYANNIDVTIIDCYQKTIICEDALHISKNEKISLRSNLRKKWRILDRGHTPIDIFTYIVAFGLLYFLPIQFPENISYCEIILVIIFFTIGWIIYLKYKKQEKLDECEKEKLTFDPEV